MGEIARRFGRPLMPWQQDWADVAYEYDPDTGLFRYKEADGTVPRQSGKTTIVLAKKVHRLTAMARQLGPQRATYTAQTRLAARKKLERDFSELLRGSRAFREVTNAKARPQKATEWRLSLNNGSEAIQFGTGSFLQIDAPSRTGGHGDTLDDGTIDEAFAHKDDTVEAGMRPAMATRKNAQLWVISTAGDADSKYLYRKVLAGRAAHASGEHGAVCYLEYSAPDDADPGDPATWWACMPALGITITEDFIAGEWERAQRKGQEGVNTFRRAYLNQWPEVPKLEDDEVAAISPEAWSALASPSSRPVRPVLAVAVAQDRSWSALVAAWRVSSGKVRVEVVRYAPTTTWVADKVAELRRDYPGAVVLLSQAARGLVPGAEEPSQGAQAMADNALADAVIAGSLEHGDQAELLTSVQASRWRPSGDTRVLDRKGNTDISPLSAAALAVHGLSAVRPQASPQIAVTPGTASASTETDLAHMGF